MDFRAPVPEPERRLVVEARTMLTPQIVQLTLCAAGGDEPLPFWQPGAHIDVVLGDGRVRQFSLCGDPADRSRYRVAVLRENDGRGGSVAVHEQLREGSALLVRGPRNHFPFEIAPSYRFIAGGIGITAILPMVRAAAAAGAEWSLDYCGKAVDRMAFAEELAALHPGRVRLHPSQAGTRLSVTAAVAAPDGVTDLYCCGPERLIQAVEQEVAAAGWPPGALHVERFVPREPGAPVWQQPFLVDLLLSGQTVEVAPEQSVLDAVREAGAVVLSSCEEGTCGTCETPVLGGAIDHRDSLLTAQERAAGDRMMVCVSRAACPRIVLEL